VPIGNNAEVTSGAAEASTEGEDDNKGKLVLLDGLTYSFTKGERVGVVGRNGAGKTSNPLPCCCCFSL